MLSKKNNYHIYIIVQMLIRTAVLTCRRAGRLCSRTRRKRRYTVARDPPLSRLTQLLNGLACVA